MSFLSFRTGGKRTCTVSQVMTQVEVNSKLQHTSTMLRLSDQGILSCWYAWLLLRYSQKDSFATLWNLGCENFFLTACSEADGAASKSAQTSFAHVLTCASL